MIKKALELSQQLHGLLIDINSKHSMSGVGPYIDELYLLMGYLFGVVNDVKYADKKMEDEAKIRKSMLNALDISLQTISVPDAKIVDAMRPLCIADKAARGRTREQALSGEYDHEACTACLIRDAIDRGIIAGWSYAPCYMRYLQCAAPGQLRKDLETIKKHYEDKKNENIEKRESQEF